MKLIRDTSAVRISGQGFIDWLKTEIRFEDNSYSLQAGETEEINIKFLEKLLRANVNGFDYKRYRSVLQYWEILRLDSTTLDAETRKAIACNGATTDNTFLLNEVVNVVDRINNHNDLFHKRAKESRENRIDYLTPIIKNTTNIPISKTILNKINGFRSKYINRGIEGTVQGDVECITDYINSVAGTTYASNGLLEDLTTVNNYAPLETAAKIVTACSNVIINGDRLM